MVNVKDQGVIGDGATDDRAALQAILDAAEPGATLYFSPGTYKVGGQLVVAKPVSLVGSGLLLQPKGVPGSTRTLMISGDDVSVTGLSFNGAKSEQTPDEHRAAIFVTGKRCQISGVRARHYTGDGIYLYTGADDATLNGVECTDNGRNGVTYGGLIQGGSVTSSKFLRNAAQQFDSEPVGAQVNNLKISRCTMDAQGVTQQYVLTVSGSSPTVMSAGWQIQDCVLNGPTNLVYAKGARFTRCTGVNPSVLATRVYRVCQDVAFVECDFEATQTEALALAGTAEGLPTGTRVLRSRLRGDKIGVLCEPAGSVELYDSEVAGLTYGVIVRSTDPTQQFAHAIVSRCLISAFNGVTAWGPGKIGRLIVRDNTFSGPFSVLANYDGSSPVINQDIGGNILLA